MLKPVLLKNGLTVLRFPKIPSNIFLCGFVVKTGSLVEAGNFPQGISNLLRTMFWCGTDRYPSKRALNTLIESIGSTFFSEVDFHSTSFYLVSPYYHQKQAVSILAEIIQHSYFDTKDLEVQKRRILDLIKKSEDSFTEECAQLSLNNLYGDTGLGLPILGTIESLLAITQEHIYEYLARQYQPSKAYLILGGNFDNKTILPTIDQYWSIWQPKSQPTIDLFEPKIEDLGNFPRVLYKQRGIPTTHLMVNFVLPQGLAIKNSLSESGLEKKPDSEESEQLLEEKLFWLAKLYLLNTVLGTGFSSRLWVKGVEEEMFFEDVQSELVLFKHTGFLKIYGATENSQFTFALESILSVLEGLKKTTMSITELNKAKEQLKGNLLIDNESLVNYTKLQVKNLIFSDYIWDLEKLLYKIDEIDTTDIRNLANQIFSLENLFLTILGTAKQTRLVEKLIQKFLAT